MRASPVKPEFGPTLAELAGPRLRALPRTARLALGIAAAVLLAGAVVLAATSRENLAAVVVREPVAFNFRHPPALVRVPSAPGTVRLVTRRGPLFVQSFAVRPVRLPPYRGDINGTLPLWATGFVERLRARHAGFVLVGEGKARNNDVPGYSVVFRARLGRRTLYGRHVLLFGDEPATRDGVDVEMLATPAAGVPNADAIGTTGALKQAYRSFRLGTERP